MKKITCFLVVILLLFPMAGCGKKASRFTEEEHIRRVTERVEKRFMTEESSYTGFSVYRLYAENDELKYFLVEFEPCGFVYVILDDEEAAIYSCFGLRTSMYSISKYDGKETWSRYAIDETNSQPEPDTDKIWEVDENGERIVYERSPYEIAGVNGEKRYLFRCTDYYVPAIKSDDGYLNLISMDEFQIVDGQYSEKQVEMYIAFFASKELDL